MILLDDDAREELLAAVEWYDDQREGLGSEFLACVDAALVRAALEWGRAERDRVASLRARRTLGAEDYPTILTACAHVAGIRT